MQNLGVVHNGHNGEAEKMDHRLCMVIDAEALSGARILPSSKSQ